MTKDKSETSAEEFFPERKSLKAFREAAADCKACDLWKRGTQTVFGEGARRAEIVFVGEQPGNEEDLTGHRPNERRGARVAGRPAVSF